MKARRDTPRDNFTPALEAIGNLLLPELNGILSGGWSAAQSAHTEIQHALINHKPTHFYRHFLPLRQRVVSLLAGGYRRYFKLALAHPHQAGPDLHQWACSQLQPFVGASLDWIREWYILACDGENQFVRHIASTEFVPGGTISLQVPTTLPPFPSSESWRAPAWLFAVSLALVGIGLLKPKNVPATDSDQKLGAAHTRLLLKGARRVILWELGAAIETVRNEEIAAAGAVPSETSSGQMERPNKAPKHWLKGFDGLGPKKSNLSRYMHNMTEKQQLAFSLKYEYGLGPTETASRMGIDRKTLREHLDAANKRLEEDRSFEKRRIDRSKSSRNE